MALRVCSEDLFAVPEQKGTLPAMASTVSALVPFCSDTRIQILQLQLHCASLSDSVLRLKQCVHL